VTGSREIQSPREIQTIDTLERASALLHPMRLRILARAAEPVSAVELAKELGETPQKLNYHLKALEKAGLLTKVREEKKRNLTKAYYQARAKRLWFSPRLVEKHGDDARATRDRLSLHNLLGLAHGLEQDVIRVLNREEREPRGAASLGVRAELRFADGEARRAFMEEYMAALDGLVRKFSGPTTGGGAGERFTAIVAVYPSVSGEGDAHGEREAGTPEGRREEGRGEEGGGEPQG
jgi:DNA-binding transcriptional ArsR family regulator